MRADRHWIIKSIRNHSFNNPYNAQQECHPVTSSDVNFDTWRQAYGVAKHLDEHGFEGRWLGRRCNDEVELFLKEGEEEYALLKVCLEEHGFTVRPYVVPSAQKKGGGGKKIMNEIKDKVGYLVQETEYDEEVKITTGLLAEVVGSKKVLAIVSADQEMINHLKNQEDATITDGIFQTEAGPKQLGKVLGEIKNTIDINFWAADDFVRKFFDGQGAIHHVPEFVDFIERKKREAAEQRKKDKKAAKKHRRMMTESTTTATTPSELSVGEDGNEATKSRQRAKQNEKRKKQAQRRREEAATEAAEDAKQQAGINKSVTFTLKNNSDSEDSNSNSSDSGTWDRRIMGDALISTNAKGHVRVQQLSAPIQQRSWQQIVAEALSEKERESEAVGEAQTVVEAGVEESEAVKKPRVKLPKMEYRKDSVKDSGSEDEGEENKTVVVQTMAELRPYMESGNPIVVVHPEDDTDASKGWNMRYLGKGL